MVSLADQITNNYNVIVIDSAKAQMEPQYYSIYAFALSITIHTPLISSKICTFDSKIASS